MVRSVRAKHEDGFGRVGLVTEARERLIAAGTVAFFSSEPHAAMIEPISLMFEANGWVPNNPALPVLIYRGLIAPDDADLVEAKLRANGWRPDWRDGVFPFHHYHTSAHEALACIGGRATLMLGGEGGRELRLSAGDLLALPAGTGHCCVRATEDFLLIGAYPQGQIWDVCRAAADAATLKRIAAVPLPAADPLAGEDGPLTKLWRTVR